MGSDLRRKVPRLKSGKAGGLLLIALWVLAMGGCAAVDPDFSGKMLGVTVDTGTLSDREGEWRGMVMGGPFQEPVKGRLPEIGARASREAVQHKMPVVYLTSDGHQRLEALFMEGTDEAKCFRVRERIYQNGELVREEFKKVCP